MTTNFTVTTVSYHLTKRIAEHRQAELEVLQQAGRSSGWKRIDYSVKRSTRTFRRWRVIALSL